jgi:DNA-binding response OmpR family regulator
MEMVYRMTKRILIIDDEEHIRRMIRLTLESAGYDVGQAADGFAGLKRLAEAKWDMVILDQRMPGMDGLTTLERIKQRDPTTRVLMATAYASIELAVAAMKLGASDFVRKPMTPETLRNAVSALLEKQVVAPPLAQQSTPDHLVETITMNGFTIVDPEGDQWRAADERRFIVLSPSGGSHEVVVKIDEEVVAYVERMTRRRLAPGSSFWTTEARRLLSDYLWNNGDVPRMKFLVLNEINRDELPVAERWNDN